MCLEEEEERSCLMVALVLFDSVHQSVKES